MKYNITEIYAVLGAIASTTPSSSFSTLDVNAPELGDKACSKVHIFLARGNNEPFPGRQGKLVDAICSRLEGCDYEDIQFNNPLEADYCLSVHEGAVSGVAQITAYNKRCPDTALVVSGYSQGAHVVGDVLGSGGGTFFNGCVEDDVPGLDPSTSPGNQVKAALTFGDTRHTANTPFNFQTGATKPGLFPRAGVQLDNRNKFDSVSRDFCVVDDPICAGGGNGQTHLAYFDVFTDQAADFVKATLGGNSTAAPAAPALGTATGSSSTTKASATGTTATTLSKATTTGTSTTLSVFTLTSTGTSAAGTAAETTTAASSSSTTEAAAETTTALGDPSSPMPTRMSENAAAKMSPEAAMAGANVTEAASDAARAGGSHFITLFGLTTAWALILSFII